ncbi:zinc finger HIT domain-containing protein 3-like [Patiria miniata]|uniref:Zinc finger HIT domain-containing protein n=1 Tax=Patiria miniata TaxID=46514 RepID=A0A914A4T4_PATMI|nr:zinc finger HIT domain-containing protein 3-like [Patiria miniata]
MPQEKKLEPAKTLMDKHNGFQSEEEHDDRIPQECLDKLAESSDLKTLLHNKHLQRLLLEVDRVKDKAAMVERFMQEPLFVEFADACLAAVAPEEKHT